MNILITGGYGFIGSNFINYFFNKHQHVNIVNVDAMYYCANQENVHKEIRDSSRYTFIKGNTSNLDLMSHILQFHNITHVIHFAAQSHVQNSFEESLQYTMDNIMGTHVLLEACRQYNKLERFIHVSTDEVYGESSIDINEKMHESSLVCPTNPYAATKAGAEMIVMSYYRSFRMPIIITRGNNVYGPNQYPEKLIPKFIELLKNNEKVTIQGDGSHIRSFVHAFDVVKAFELILFNGQIGEIYNIGGDDHHEYSVMDIAKILIEKIKKTINYDDWIDYIPDRPFNDKRYYISNEKIVNLGWKIEHDLHSGLSTILD